MGITEASAIWLTHSKTHCSSGWLSDSSYNCCIESAADCDFNNFFQFFRISKSQRQNCKCVIKALDLFCDHPLRKNFHEGTKYHRCEYILSTYNKSWCISFFSLIFDCEVDLHCLRVIDVWSQSWTLWKEKRQFYLKRLWYLQNNILAQSKWKHVSEATLTFIPYDKLHRCFQVTYIKTHN